RIKPNQTGPDRLTLDQTGPDRPRPPKTGPQNCFDGFKPDQTGSNPF
ncbi:hypothetical protein CP02DC14_1774, partial [Chlamydia psittaci 02DC14]